MMFCIYFVYEGFKMAFWFDSYHKNIINERDIAVEFAFKEKMIHVSFF